MPTKTRAEMALTITTAADYLEELATQTTPGPWRARYTDRFGWPVEDPESDWSDPDESEGQFNLLAGTALPREDDRDAGHYQSQHVIAEYDDHDTPEQDRERWANLRWAAALNPGSAAFLVGWLRTAAAEAQVDRLQTLNAVQFAEQVLAVAS